MPFPSLFGTVSVFHFVARDLSFYRGIDTALPWAGVKSLGAAGDLGSRDGETGLLDFRAGSMDAWLDLVSLASGWLARSPLHRSDRSLSIARQSNETR